MFARQLTQNECRDRPGLTFDGHDGIETERVGSKQEVRYAGTARAED